MSLWGGIFANFAIFKYRAHFDLQQDCLVIEKNGEILPK
jgi:hypothetical protein